MTPLTSHTPHPASAWTGAANYAALSQVSLTEIRRETGLELARRAIELRPSFAAAHSLLSAGDLQTASGSAERASVLDPRSPVIAANRASVQLALGRTVDARDRCLRLLKRTPTSQGCLLCAGSPTWCSGLRGRNASVETIGGGAEPERERPGRLS